jgi:serine/threonine protein kinase
MRSIIGPYRLTRRLGSGGMGEVWEAIDDRLRRRVAIKVLSPQYAGRQDVIGRLHSEAIAVNVIEHPGVVQIHEYGQLEDGSAYLVMEYLRGESLSDRLRRSPGPMAEAEAVELGAQLASALHAAHEQGIVHRDLKPGNIMMVADPASRLGERAKLLDFGIAKFVQGVTDVPKSPTQSNMILGTPQYISPEQCRSQKDIDGKADVYSLGVLLYRLVAGKLPFTASDAMELMQGHVFDAPPSLEEAAPLASKGLVVLIHQMLEKDRDLRPGMHDVLKRLEGVRMRAAAASLPFPPILRQVMASLEPIQGSRQNKPTELMPGVSSAAPIAVRPTKLIERLMLPMARIRSRDRDNVSRERAMPANANPVLASGGSAPPEVSTMTLQKRKVLLGAIVGLLAAGVLAGTGGASLWPRLRSMTSHLSSGLSLSAQYSETALKSGAASNAALPAIRSQMAPPPPAQASTALASPPMQPPPTVALAPSVTVVPDEQNEAGSGSLLSLIPRPHMKWDSAMCEQWSDLGYTQKAASQFQASFDAFKAAYEGCGKPSLLNELGRAQESMGRYDIALAFYQWVLTQEPKQSDDAKKIARKREEDTCRKAAEHYALLPLDSDGAAHPLTSPPVVEYIQSHCADERFILARAHVLYMRGRYADSISACDLYLSTQPTPDLYTKARTILQAAQRKLQETSQGATKLQQ